MRKSVGSVGFAGVGRFSHARKSGAWAIPAAAGATYRSALHSVISAGAWD
jgi:hypothetical protein